MCTTKLVTPAARSNFSEPVAVTTYHIFALQFSTYAFNLIHNDGRVGL